MKESELYEILNSLNMFECYEFNDEIKYTKVPFGFIVKFYVGRGNWKAEFIYNRRDK